MNVSRPAGALLVGVIFMVLALILAGTIIDAATTAGTNADISSYTGALSLNNLFPFIYYAVTLIASVGLIGVGGAGLAGKGPLRG